MDADGSIRTQFDDLVTSLKSAGRPQSVSELSAVARLPQGDVAKWLYILEKHGNVRLQNRISGLYATWVSGPEKSKPIADEVVVASLSADIEIARERESEARMPREKKEDGGAKMRHRLVLEQADADLAHVGEKITRINSLLSELKQKRRTVKEAAEAKLAEEAASVRADEEARKKKALLDAAETEASEIVAEFSGKVSREPQAPEAVSFEEDEATVSAPEPQEEERPVSVAEPERAVHEERVPVQAFKAPKGKIKPIYKPRKKSIIDKISKPAPLQVTGVSLQFSERMARQVKKIVSQTQAIEQLRMEKEKLLAEHYQPMQRKLEVEIETISDRVLRIEKDILSLHQRASELPEKASSVEKLQISSIKAHAEMRKAYDEATALMEESGRMLSEEREKMQLMVEQSRQEIAGHRAKSEELEGTLSRIDEMEEQAQNAVIAARAALAEQAERLATAEKSAHELSSLKDEIGDSVTSIKREISTAKGVLTTLDKQLSQMRQIELWAESIRQDYDRKMLEVNDYIKGGNQEFETLREAVEANFVRRYLRELRQLTDSYTFEFNQVRAAEGSIDARIAGEKKRLESLLEEGRKISYLYEMQSKAPEGAGDFEKHGEEFREISDISAQRSQLEQMIAQVVGRQSEYQPAAKKEAPAAAPKKPVAKAKAAAKKPAAKGAKAKKTAKKEAPRKPKGRKRRR